MSRPNLIPDIDDDEAELAALAKAVAKARVNTRSVSHEDMSAWLLRIADGDFEAPLPVAREK